jgi:propionyl-CoA carboxylase beta chain
MKIPLWSCIKLCWKYYCRLCQIRRKKHWYCGKSALVLSWSFDVNSSKKKRQDLPFLRLFQHPFVGLDVPGFLPGTDQEWHGIIVHGAKLLYALSEATVPRITVIHEHMVVLMMMNSKHIGADMNYVANCRNCCDGSQRSLEIIFKKRN